MSAPVPPDAGLLKRFGKLPATLTISLLNTSPPRVTTVKLTIKGRHKPAGKHRH